MLSFSRIEADVHRRLIFMLLMLRRGWYFGGWSLSLCCDIQQPLMLIRNNNNVEKTLANCIFPTLFLPLTSSPCLCADTVPVLPHSSLLLCSIVSLRGGDPVSVGCISSPALYSGGDLDSQSIFPLQLSQQTPKVVSRLFSRSDINLALPFYIKNACIVRER